MALQDGQLFHKALDNIGGSRQDVGVHSEWRDYMRELEEVASVRREVATSKAGLGLKES
jgi:hypothetical protein